MLLSYASLHFSYFKLSKRPLDTAAQFCSCSEHMNISEVQHWHTVSVPLHPRGVAQLWNSSKPNWENNIFLFMDLALCAQGRCHATTGVTHASWQHIYTSHTGTTLYERTDSSKPCGPSSGSNNTETHVLLSNLLQSGPNSAQAGNKRRRRSTHLT